jgi:hypothetical protein
MLSIRLIPPRAKLYQLRSWTLLGLVLVSCASVCWGTQLVMKIARGKIVFAADSLVVDQDDQPSNACKIHQIGTKVFFWAASGIVCDRSTHSSINKTMAQATVLSVRLGSSIRLVQKS